MAPTALHTHNIELHSHLHHVSEDLGLLEELIMALTTLKHPNLLLSYIRSSFFLYCAFVSKACTVACVC